MSTIAQREEQAITLDRIVSQIDAQARDDGHLPERWQQAEDAGDLTASTRCLNCGREAAVRVGDGRAWKAGRLRLAPCPSPAEQG